MPQYEYGSRVPKPVGSRDPYDGNNKGNFWTMYEDNNKK